MKIIIWFLPNRQKCPSTFLTILWVLSANPRKRGRKAPEEVKFKWEDYHQEQLAESELLDDEDDDWDDFSEEDEDGVEIIYKP